MKKIFEAVKKFVGLGIFLISLLLISSYVYAVYPANNLALNNNLMEDISPHINRAYAWFTTKPKKFYGSGIPINPTNSGGGGFIHYRVSTSAVIRSKNSSNGALGSISPSYIDVARGATATFSVVPSSGYNTTVTGCNGSLSGTTYITGTIFANCTVTATFRVLPPTVNYFTTTTASNKVDMGAKPFLKWDISNFSSCTITSPAIVAVHQTKFNHSFSNSQPTGSKKANPIYAPTTYTLKCNTAVTSGLPTVNACQGTVVGSIDPKTGYQGKYEGYDCLVFKTQSTCLQGWVTHGCSWTSY